MENQEKHEFRMEEKIEILQSLESTIEYALHQTSPQHRDDLRQHLYELVIKTLKTIKLSEPRGLSALNEQFLNKG